MDDYVPATGSHSWDDGKVTKEATCTEAGVKTYTCSVCGATKTEEIPAKGHTEVKDEAVAATCTETGLTEGSHCSVCNAVIKAQELVPALGHEYKNGVCTRCGAADPSVEPTPTVSFVDVSTGDWFYSSVKWAVENEITTGGDNNKFYPMNNCTRAQIVTFLWRAEGESEADSGENPFSDVPESAWYYEAVLWAVEQGITGGTGGGKFSPDKVCTRCEIVTFLWRNEGEPDPESSENPFSDVSESAWYYNAVLWAVENGITNGTGSGFAPMNTCTRAEAVTFLQRYESLWYEEV